MARHAPCPAVISNIVTQNMKTSYFDNKMLILKAESTRKKRNDAKPWSIESTTSQVLHLVGLKLCEWFGIVARLWSLLTVFKQF